ncbi:hypothetical protein ACLBYD_15885 [Rhodococcus sp. C26F]
MSHRGHGHAALAGCYLECVDDATIRFTCPLEQTGLDVPDGPCEERHEEGIGRLLGRGDVEDAFDPAGDRMHDRVTVTTELLERFEEMLVAVNDEALTHFEWGAQRVRAICLFGQCDAW